MVSLLYRFKKKKNNNSFETGDGTKRQEQGTVKKATSADSSDVVVVQGQVSYTAPDGQQITLIYAADDTNGFQPQASIYSFFALKFNVMLFLTHVFVVIVIINVYFKFFFELSQTEK